MAAGNQDPDNILNEQNGREDNQDDDNIEIVMGTEADVTEEDLLLLGDKDEDMDLGDDEQEPRETLDDTDMEGDLLNDAIITSGKAGNELDMPGIGDVDPQTGDEELDEENDYYSQADDGEEDTAQE